MAEAEDVLVDVARHATVSMQRLWQRHRSGAPAAVGLAELAGRLDALLTASFGMRFRLRPAQVPGYTPLVAVLFRHDRRPRQREPVPCTDGQSIWLPPDCGTSDYSTAAVLYRAMAFHQATRARRGGPQALEADVTPVVADVFLLLEAATAELTLLDRFPGLGSALQVLRNTALAKRPHVSRFGQARRPLEKLSQDVLADLALARSWGLHPKNDPAWNLGRAERLIREYNLIPRGLSADRLGPSPLLKDWWTGCFLPAQDSSVTDQPGTAGRETEDEPASPPRSARLRRQPRRRRKDPREDRAEKQSSPWMVQVEQPHQHAEDPMGIQRPVDRDEETDSGDFADLVSDLPEARLVSTPGSPREILLSDDPPDSEAHVSSPKNKKRSEVILYPEWDWRRQQYRDPGVRVHVAEAAMGSTEWVAATLARQRPLLNEVRRRFELMRAQHVWLRRRADGEDLDLDACVAGLADYRAGAALPERLYQTRRRLRRDLAITLLVDTSGSTDSWVQGSRRVIDVEREALLLVSHALEALGASWSALTFSGRGPGNVQMRVVKGFGEAYGHGHALRIAALEPEDYTRAGGAVRHASAGLMRQPAEQRLLLLLSDGKPNDQDEYNGRYGVEDMRRSITEARLQGIETFCLTIDRQASSYLPRIFGAHQYALLPRPERLPEALLGWLKRLVTS